MITYRPGSQRGQSDALLRRSYLVPKERDATYDQQHSILLKLEQLLLRTLHTTIAVDPTFLKDIRINLLSDPLALKLKQSYADSKSQNGQSSKFPNSKLGDPRSRIPGFPEFQLT
jgi:hypothetical protein